MPEAQKKEQVKKVSEQTSTCTAAIWLDSTGLDSTRPHVNPRRTWTLLICQTNGVFQLNVKNGEGKETIWV
jgi:hypothetical protein